jgi:hypothetical protein
VTVLVRNPDGSDTPISKTRDHYLSHFATCPSAQKHRAPRTKTTAAEQDSADQETESSE